MHYLSLVEYAILPWTYYIPVSLTSISKVLVAHNFSVEKGQETD